LNKNRKYTNTVAENRFLPSIKELFQMLLTFGLVVIGWVFFRAETIGEAVEYLGGIFNKNLLSVPLLIDRVFHISMFINLVILIIAEWLQRNKQHGLELSSIKSQLVKFAIYYALIIRMFLFGGQAETFIYFQF